MLCLCTELHQHPEVIFSSNETWFFQTYAGFSCFPSILAVVFSSALVYFWNHQVSDSVHRSSAMVVTAETGSRCSLPVYTVTSFFGWRKHGFPSDDESRLMGPSGRRPDRPVTGIIYIITLLLPPVYEVAPRPKKAWIGQKTSSQNYPQNSMFRSVRDLTAAASVTNNFIFTRWPWVQL